MHERVAVEIEEIRIRLAQIDEERQVMAEEDGPAMERLLEEEHRLQNRLSELEDTLVELERDDAQEKASAQTDITGTPELPDGPSER